ncbi:MAG: copper resistance CopC/CopD family protein [Pseudodonghicola sp.]
MLRNYSPRLFGASGILFGAILFAWLAFCSQAFAHASLTGTNPKDGEVIAAAPAQLSLSFSEPVSPLALNLIRPDGSTLPLEDFAVRDRTVEIETPQELSDGTHVLTWRVVSEDGHPVGGSVIFSIGEPSASPPPVAEPVDPAVRAGLWISKVMLYLGMFFGIGGAFAVVWLAPQSRPGARVAAIAAVIGIAGTAISPGLQGLDALGATMSRLFDLLMWSTGMGTSYGHTVLVMLVALACALLALVARDALARLLSLIGLLTGGVALALSGHASAAEPQWLMRPAVFAHAFAIAFWIGALLPMGLALRADTADATAVLRRFSNTIPYVVALLVASGITLAVVQVQQPSALIETSYGRLLLAKLALLVLLFGLAAFNRWKLTEPAQKNEAAAKRHLVRSIVIETVLVLAILGIAAGWRFTPPPRSLAIAAAQPVQMHIHTAKAMADVTVAPGRTGPVTVSAVVMSGEFGPLDAKEVTFVFSNPSAGIEAFRRKAGKPGDGTWRADEVVLPLPGKWTVRLDILITDFDLARIQGEIEIRP